MHRPAALVLTLCALVLTVSTVTAEDLVRVELGAFDLFDTPITEVPLGTDFELRAYVTDLRENVDFHGLFAAYVRVDFPAALVSPNGPVQVETHFNQIVVLASTDASTVFGGGASASFPDLAAGGEPQLLFSVLLHATHVGSVLFEPSNGATTLDDEWLLYGKNDVVAVDQLQFVNLPLAVVPEPSGLLLGTLGLAAAVVVSTRHRRRPAG